MSPAAQCSIRSLEKHTLASWAFGSAAPNSLGPSPSRFILISMKHHICAEGSKRTAKYQWKVKHQCCQLTAQATGPPEPPQEGSLEQFITEHYWGYSTQRSGGSVEYHVSHVPWQVWVSTTAGFEGDASLLYGVELSHVLQGHLSSAFIAEGSEVTVFRGNKLP